MNLCFAARFFWKGIWLALYLFGFGGIIIGYNSFFNSDIILLFIYLSNATIIILLYDVKKILLSVKKILLYNYVVFMREALTTNFY